MKLAWISVGGPSRDVAAALEALELLSDTFLSVATPVQEALPDLLRLAPTIRSSILERVRSNARLLQSACERPGALELLPVEGGWSAVLRVPSIGSDESLVLELLRDERVLVHPGYFFDFPRDGFVVLSLLPAEPLFREGVARLLGFLERRFR